MKRILILISSAILLSTACLAEKEDDRADTVQADPAVQTDRTTVDSPMAAYLEKEWSLSFADEFDGNEIDDSLWSFEIGNGHAKGIPGWGNAELQYYTNAAENAFLRDGRLVIHVREEEKQDAFGNYAYTSARMITQNKLSVQYGRIDVRAKMPSGRGIWPAIWMLGENIDVKGWPACGEIDIMELLGHQVFRVHGTIHGPGYSAGNGIGNSHISQNSFAENFHVFSLIWDEDILIWLVDDVPYHHVTAEYVKRSRNAEWVFNQEFFFILNVAVGGHWPGYPDNSTSFPQEMEIDYIRIFTAVQ